MHGAWNGLRTYNVVDLYCAHFLEWLLSFVWRVVVFEIMNSWWQSFPSTAIANEASTTCTVIRVEREAYHADRITGCCLTSRTRNICGIVIVAIDGNVMLRLTHFGECVVGGCCQGRRGRWWYCWWWRVGIRRSVTADWWSFWVGSIVWCWIWLSSKGRHLKFSQGVGVGRKLTI